MMKMNFPEDSATNQPAEHLQKGDTVTVVGASHRRGHLIVENNGASFHVPFQFMELVKGGCGGGATEGLSTATATAGQVATVAAVVAAAAAAAAASAAANANIVNLM